MKPNETTSRHESALPSAEPEAARPTERFECDHCGGQFDGPPHGSGLFLWTRGDEYRIEEPPLCETCALEISVGAVVKWESEADEE